ncbi:MAG: L,D-transpeptidase [Nitratireductor sp.]|nr:L,D-transpeptidase [Nitratireductor sp.]
MGMEHSATKPGRRAFLIGATAMAATALAGCESPRPFFRGPSFAPLPERPSVDVPVSGSPADVGSNTSIYGTVLDSGRTIPAIDLARVAPEFRRQQVEWLGPERPGTLIVDTGARHLFLIRENRTALRYGVGVGREGFAWSGKGVIQWKQKWPKWTPPAEMIARQPELEKYSVDNGGMPGGLENPLGARALYIFSGGVDTLFRIHGTPEYWSIGKAVSSGCIRMMNQDVIDLYDRIPDRTPVIVR